MGQDIVLIQPAKIWINFVVISSSVSRHVRKLCERLSLRSRLMMMRTHGMMRDADCNMQHFNPACRAARRFPHLPIARLLLTLNDADLPKAKLPNPYLLPFTYFSAGLFALAYLPEVLQETVLDVLAGAGIDFGMIGMYSLAKTSLIFCMLLAFLVVVVFVGREVYVRGQWQRERFSAMHKYTEQEEQELREEQVKEKSGKTDMEKTDMEHGMGEGAGGAGGARGAGGT
jgi:hypothetical protein